MILPQPFLFYGTLNHPGNPDVKSAIFGGALSYGCETAVNVKYLSGHEIVCDKKLLFQGKSMGR